MINRLKKAFKKILPKPLLTLVKRISAFFDTLKNRLVTRWEYQQAIWTNSVSQVYLIARRYCKIKEKTVLWESFYGRGIVDNPKALFEVMLTDPAFQGWKHTWVLDDFKTNRETIRKYNTLGIQFIRYRSLKYFYALATTKVFVRNASCLRCYVRREGQIDINTWHGIPLKYIGCSDQSQDVHQRSFSVRSFLQASHLVSASPFLTEVYQRDFKLGSLFNGEILEAGYPRLDTLANANRDAVLAAMQHAGVKVAPTKKTILYAPTWRGDYGTPDTAIAPLLNVKAAIEKSLDLSQWQVLIKPHQFVYNAAREKFKDIDFMVPASMDANEVLAVTDVLVSDFSSIFYDFLLTKRPIVFYIPDLEEYQASRGLYSTVDTLPGPIAQTLEDLSSTIKHLDERIAPYASAYAEQRKWAGCEFDQGDNSRRILHHILLQKEKQPTASTEKKQRFLFLLPPNLGKAHLYELTHLLTSIDPTQVDVTLFTEGDKQGSLEYLAEQLPTTIRLLIRRHIFRTKRDEANWQHYRTHGASSLHFLPKQYFKEEASRYLGSQSFDLVIDVSGTSLFYTTLATLVPTKKCLVWALTNLHSEAATTRKGLVKNFPLYPKFNAIVTHTTHLREQNKRGFDKKANLNIRLHYLEKHLNPNLLTTPYITTKDSTLFDFAIVMTVSNVLPILERSILNIVAQDIGFKDHIQLILVDNGASDGSAELCDNFAERFPNNIIVIHNGRKGAISARNAGLRIAKGKWINFLDPDDVLPINALSKVKAFSDLHYTDTDVITLPIKFYSETTAESPTNAKFKKGERVIDLAQEPNAIHTLCASAFIRKTALNGIRFPACSTTGGESCVIQQVLLQKPFLGVVKTGMCKCHSRKSDTIWIRDAKVSPLFYAFPAYFQTSVLNQAVEHYGEIPRFIQRVASYHCQWLIKELPQIEASVSLTEDAKLSFINSTHSIISAIDVDSLLTAKGLQPIHQLTLLSKKYNRKATIKRLEQNLFASFEAVPNLFPFTCLQWHSMQIKGDTLLLYIAATQLEAVSQITAVFAQSATHVFEATLLTSHCGTRFIDEPMSYRNLYQIEIPLANLPDTTRLTFHFTVDNVTYQANQISRHYRFPITNKFKAAYCVLGNRCFTASQNRLTILTTFNHWQRERNLLREIISKRQENWKEDLFIRIIAFIRKKHNCKPIWLLKDRATNGDDNAEAMFLHLRQHHPEVKAYFVIDKYSPDGKRLKKFGHIVHFGSFKNRLLDSIAAVWLSSHGRSWILPDESKNHARRDFVALRPFIFLQHGITKDYVSWIGRYEQNFAGIVAAATSEYHSFINEPYGYSAKESWLTGFPRFDRLYRNEKKQITIMPTWRKWLFSHINRETGTWVPLPGFTESDYFKFYNALINHPRLIHEAKQYGYHLRFFAHPTMRLSGLADGFDYSNCTVLPPETSYRDIYAQSDLIVTDYSSAVFDFAYLRKPIIYTQFDKNVFFSGNHALIPGYFEYERDGFGEVTYTLESAVDYLIGYMRNGCQLKDIYRQRIDNFFAFNDCNNCERVYQKVCELLDNSQV